MKQLKIKILSWLLNQANRYTRSQHYYTIKNKILAKYGVHQRYDVQFIEGKPCHACDGTGIYIGYGYNGKYHNACRRCCGGWYKLPVWNILACVKFGAFTFHQPYKRVYENPGSKGEAIIDGYIEHTSGKYGALACHILYLLYEKGYLRRYYKQAGVGWYLCWWQPRWWLPNAIHIIKRGRESIPAQNIAKWFSTKPKTRTALSHDYDEDLPF